MIKIYIWLVLRLIKKQKLRTVTIFCGILFSCILLITFCSFGYDFWKQVHQGAGEEAEFDFTQKVLILLMAVLLLLIVMCAAILLHNLFSLTFPQRWQSLVRLVSLGADPAGLVGMGLLENLLLYMAAAPAGVILSLAAVHRIGIQYRIPVWMMAAILAGILLFSCVCNIRPLLSVLHQTEFRRTQCTYRQRKRLVKTNADSVDDSADTGRKHRNRNRRRKAHHAVRSFPLYISARYRQTNRGHYFRTTVTILAAILLYVPASYLIDTNISVQQSGLYEKYGILYNCHPRDKVQLEAALEEYRQLAALCEESGSMGYVAFYTTASVDTARISSELQRELKKAGWQESNQLYVNSIIFFVEDEIYAGYTKEESILVNRYTNRNSWSQDKDLFFVETPLLEDGADCSGVTVYTAFCNEAEADPESGISPRAVTDQIPEGLGDTSRLSLVMPLSSLEQFCFAGTDYYRLQVQGKFVDSDEELFSRMERCLGESPAGGLTDTRKVIREWYSSMEGIHRAMNAVCATLFVIAVLNVFSMMVFQYMERKKGLAILWSLGQNPGELFQLLFLERVHHFLAAMLAGIPVSAFLCYYIYRVFRQAWQVPFTLPLRQMGLITAAMLAVLNVTALVNGCLMKRQNFLENIKDMT
ncbi:MAG: ABC transporter permease [Lachnospiraceae bacterium]|nr:ABC transporter permease [Lachnospiraceae bacterium]